MITLTSIDHINASPEQVWHFLTHLHEDGAYKQWHPVEHIIWKQLGGDGETVGSTYHFAEMIGGKKLESGFRLDKAERLEYLEYGASGVLRPLRIVTATFDLKPLAQNKTELTAQVNIGYNLPIIGAVIDWIARKTYDMTAVATHMREEGQYLDKALSEKKRQ